MAFKDFYDIVYKNFSGFFVKKCFFDFPFGEVKQRNEIIRDFTLISYKNEKNLTNFFRDFFVAFFHKSRPVFSRFEEKMHKEKGACLVFAFKRKSVTRSGLTCKLFGQTPSDFEIPEFSFLLCSFKAEKSAQFLKRVIYSFPEKFKKRKVLKYRKNFLDCFKRHLCIIPAFVSNYCNFAH